MKLYARNYETKPFTINERIKIPYAQPKKVNRTRKFLFAEPWDGFVRKGPVNSRAALENRQSTCFLAVLTAGRAQFEDSSA